MPESVPAIYIKRHQLRGVTVGETDTLQVVKEANLPSLASSDDSRERPAPHSPTYSSHQPVTE